MKIDLRLLIKKIQLFGADFSDKVSSFVGTWKFVFFYTITMFLWIGLHLAGVLNIDSPDFIKWNLWLSYFAGTQASIVLMSSTRQSNKDRKEQRRAIKVDIKTLELSKENNAKIQVMADQIGFLEDLIEDFIREENEKK